MNAPVPFTYDMLRLSEMLDHVRDSLNGASVNIFRMDDRLVYNFRWEAPSDDEDNLRRDARALVVEDVNDFRLLEYIIKHAPFVRLDKNGNPKDYAPTRTLATHFRSSKERWRFRVLNGVIQAPTLRADGSLLVEEGYDKASGLFLDLGGVQYPAIKHKPTRADALAALKVLMEPFSEFPWVEEDFECPSLSVVLSAVLTGLIRRTLRTAPLHGFDAPEAGSGKGLACNVVTIIVTGHHATAINYSTSETEFRKLLFSALLANDQVIMLDNISRPLEGDALCTALAEATMGDRVLGISENARVPTNALFLANGNNLQVKGDMHRRIISARIVAGERPEERSFKRKNLLAWVEEQRPALVAAGLTILRAYEVAGRPAQGLPEYGSFEEWTARVRNVLVWLGQDDPCKTRERFRISEPTLEALGAVLRTVHEALGVEWFTSADIAKLAEEYHDDQPCALSQALHEAAVSAEAKTIGIYLAKNEGRTKDGLKLTGLYDTHVKRWKFRVTEESAG